MILDRILPSVASDRSPQRRADEADEAGPPAPDDDFWYHDAPGKTAAGIMVTPERALAVAAVWRAVTMLSRDVGSLGCHVYRRLATGGKVRAPGHPLYHLLRNRPNAWQTSVEYWEMAVGHMALRGSHYSQIVEGPRGFADQLVPLSPARMRVVQLLPSRRLAYFYTPEDGGPERPFLQDEIFHLRWYTLDGYTGVGPVTFARESFGLAMAAEQYGARFFSQNSRPAGVLKTDQALTDDQYRRIRKQWEDVYRGLQGSHKTAILEKGLEWQQVGLSNEDAQFLATREFQTREVGNWFGVPEHKLAMAKTPTFASIEAYDTDYYMSGVRPLCVKIEQAVLRDLILAEDLYFAEFLMEGRLRGDMTARSTFYHNGILDGWLTRNEVREAENKNPLPGLDAPLEPRNMAPAGSQPAPSAAAAVVPLARAAAERVARKELAAIRKIAQRSAARTGPWLDALDRFYTKHRGFVAQVLRLDDDTATAYAEGQLAALKTDGLAAAQQWEATLADDLTTLALRGGFNGEAAPVGRSDATAADGAARADLDLDSAG